MRGERPSAPGVFRVALALSIVGVSGCIGTNGLQFRRATAGSYMRTIEESKDPNARYVAYDKLGSTRAFDDDVEKTRAAQLLTVKLKNGNEPDATRAVICRTLGVLSKPVAREAILASTNDEEPLVRAEACRSLGRVGRVDDATILARVMIMDPSPECKVAAIESLGDLKSPDRRITELLVQGMEIEQPVIRVACLKALKSITGKDLGVDPIAWKKDLDASSPKPASPPAEADSKPALENLPVLPPEIP